MQSIKSQVLNTGKIQQFFPSYSKSRKKFFRMTKAVKFTNPKTELDPPLSDCPASKFELLLPPHRLLNALAMLLDLPSIFRELE